MTKLNNDLYYEFKRDNRLLQLLFVNYRKGSYILVEGKPDSSRFFIIQRGEAQCVREIDFATAPKANILGPGDFVGVIPCMSNHNQIESVVALTDLVAISVRRDQYPELIEKNTPVAMKIIRVFAARMREMNETLLTLAVQKESNNTENQLFNVAVYYDEAKEIDAATYAYYQYLKTHPTGKQAEIAKSVSCCSSSVQKLSILSQKKKWCANIRKERWSLLKTRQVRICSSSKKDRSR